MKDYIENEHMELVPESNQNTPYCYYIPHHCLQRPESQTTKFRVVSDASARTTTGQSLNTNLYTGQKMYRKIEIHPTIVITCGFCGASIATHLSMNIDYVESHMALPVLHIRDYVRYDI